MGRAKFVGADDALILEDESARMSLRGDKLPVGDLVTGVVMAVRGAAVPGGDFIVRVRGYVNHPDVHFSFLWRMYWGALHEPDHCLRSAVAGLCCMGPEPVSSHAVR